MRPPLDRTRLETFLEELSHAAREPTRLYLTGGASQLLRGLRESTVDVDLTLEPERDEVLRSMVALKDQLSVNVEIVSPTHFVPPLPGWRERCEFAAQFGQMGVYHFDPYTQALSKLERGHDRDARDVAALVGAGLVDPVRLRALFMEAEAELFRYPAIDPSSLHRAVDLLVEAGRR
ncbi:MAG: DUF6036 family nucleotidyltransferase [Vicinamibacteria bacterium]